MNMAHVDLGMQESAQAGETAQEKAFGVWLRNVWADYCHCFRSQVSIRDAEHAFAVADEGTDGYSMDGAWDAFRAGRSVEDYISTLPA